MNSVIGRWKSTRRSGRSCPAFDYRMSVVIEDNPNFPYDAVSEFWFDSVEARTAAFATPEGKAAGEDASAHCSARVHLLTEEKIIIA
jgi:uncharacterized protein (TIGR02118 family)